MPELRRRPKKKSSLKFSPVFGSKLGEDQKKGLHLNLVRKQVFAHRVCAQIFYPSYKRGEGYATVLHILFYANYTILATQGGGQCPPLKYAPVARTCLFIYLRKLLLCLLVLTFGSWFL